MGIINDPVPNRMLYDDPVPYTDGVSIQLHLFDVLHTLGNVGLLFSIFCVVGVNKNGRVGI